MTRSDAGRTTSIWMATAELPARPALDADLETDVCVVGAGIAGLTTAYLLAQGGKGVVVIDDGPVAGGETSRTTAHLTTALDDRYFRLEQLHGEDGARLARESHAAAIDRIERVSREEGIDCDFERVDGYLFDAPGDDATAASAASSTPRAGPASRWRRSRARPSPASTPAARCASPARPSSIRTKYLPGLVPRHRGPGGGSSAAPTRTRSRAARPPA